jgi:hypothetical protein
VEGGCASDPDRRSFIFTLRNHLEVPPTRFEQKRDEHAAFMAEWHAFYFGFGEGFRVAPYADSLQSGETYEAPGQGVALFHGDESGRFRAARWELWEIM